MRTTLLKEVRSSTGKGEEEHRESSALYSAIAAIRCSDRCLGWMYRGNDGSSDEHHVEGDDNLDDEGVPVWPRRHRRSPAQ